MEVFSKEFFSNYLFHPLAEDLLEKEKIHALVAAVSLTVFSAGLIPLVSYFIYDRKYSILDATPGDKERFLFVKSRAEQGNTIAECHLGTMLSEGKGIEQDLTSAINWWKKSAEKGNPSAQLHLGLAYLEGKGIEKDEKEAFLWLSKAAQQDIPGAHAKLGFMYFDGCGVQQDDKKAIYHFEKHLDLSKQLNPFLRLFLPNGSEIAYKLGTLYEKNDIQKACHYYSISYDPDAHYKIGEFYESGSGVEKDERKALMYFVSSAIGKHPEAQLKIAKAYLSQKNLDILQNSALEKGMMSLIGGGIKLAIVSNKYKLKEHEACAIYMLQEAKKNGQKEAAEILATWQQKLNAEHAANL